MIELWYDWSSVQALKVRVVLVEKELSWTGHLVELFKFEHLQPEYLALNPNGVVPTLVHEGKVVLESSVICQYLDDCFPEPALMPQAPYARAEARIWLKFFDDVVHQALRQISFELIYRPLLSRMPSTELDERLARHPDPIRAQRFRDAARGQASASAVSEATASLTGILARINGALEHSEWLAGNSFSLADISMAPFVERLDHLGLVDLAEPFLHARRWSEAMMARPSIIGARAPLEYRLPVRFPE